MRTLSRSELYDYELCTDPATGIETKTGEKTIKPLKKTWKGTVLDVVIHAKGVPTAYFLSTNSDWLSDDEKDGFIKHLLTNNDSIYLYLDAGVRNLISGEDGEENSPAFDELNTNVQSYLNHEFGYSRMLKYLSRVLGPELVTKEFINYFSSNK